MSSEPLTDIPWRRHARRRLLRALAVGGGAGLTRWLPDGWSRPVVDSVLLPAHAQATSQPADPSPDRRIGNELVFDAAGEFEVTVPAGASTVTLTLVGGAGGGGGGSSSYLGDDVPGYGGDGGAGAGGERVEMVRDVTPDETLTLVVGGGGAGARKP